MLVVLDDSTKVIDIYKLEKISSNGKDGTVYRYGDFAIKLPISGHMTVEKFKDLSNLSHNTSLLVLPLQKGETLDFNTPKNFIFAYTTRFINRNNASLETLPADILLDGMNSLREEIQEHFTPNGIAILDTNPENILVTGYGDSFENFSLNLIDHDRNITPSSTSREKEYVRTCGYDNFNDKRFAQIMYKLLLLEMLRSEELRTGTPLEEDHPTCSFVTRQTEALTCGDKRICLSEIEDALLRSDTVADTFELVKRKEL